MTKAELVEAIAGKAGVSKAAAEKVLKAFMEEVKTGIKKGERITLVGFGTFYAAERPARTGRNPRTGDEIQIPACTVPKFKAGKALKDDLN
ncbi:MAG: HU family DNA-binding protein [Deltaproteobacteria bacterium]|nr:HU family DNA-binding protein [Candidatus Anaeroferrophillus wilburensis]MBN2890084.1 HU family DNA-binding protein [Deltaproteobacteria bacterium]